MKSACHQSVVDSGFREDGQVNVEESDVDGDGNDGDGRRLDDQFRQKAEAADRLVGEASPEVAEKEGRTEAARVERQVFDAENS